MSCEIGIILFLESIQNTEHFLIKGQSHMVTEIFSTPGPELAERMRDCRLTAMLRMSDIFFFYKTKLYFSGRIFTIFYGF